jgi:hypothetical protein
MFYVPMAFIVPQLTSLACNKKLNKLMTKNTKNAFWKQKETHTSFLAFIVIHSMKI